MEQFDLVDEQDHIIGVTDKPTAHKNGQWHRIVVVYVWAPDGRLYVQHHKKYGLLDHSVGGHVARGEDYDTAAQREAAEEVNLTAPLTRLAVYPADERFWKGSVMRHWQALYECTPPAGWRFQPNDEVEKLELMTLEDIVAMMNSAPKRFTPGFIFSMAKYIEAKGFGLKLTVPELHSL